MVTYSCIQGCDTFCSNPDDHNIGDDPVFVTGPGGDFYLSQIAAGQGADSPCGDAGSDTAVNLGLGLCGRTTRTDEVPDTGVVDIGYHYPVDCNDNGIPDDEDIADGTSEDCNHNCIPDECDILPPETTCCEAHPEPGCDSPSIESCVCLIDPYCCDTEWDRVCVDEVTSEGCGLCDTDCNTNSIPDDCEPDFDGDGLIDDCDSDIDDDGVLNGDDVCDYTPLGTAVDSEGRPLGDIDKDCDTDLADYALFQDGFTGPL